MQGSTTPLNAAGLLAPYMTNPEDYKSLLWLNGTIYTYPL
jgi:hypothetical protein